MLFANICAYDKNLDFHLKCAMARYFPRIISRGTKTKCLRTTTSSSF